MSDAINFEPTEKQFIAWQYLLDKVTREVGYGGGAGGGKTWEGCFWMASMCENYPNTRWGLGRKELKNLKRTTLVTFYKVCAHYGWKAGVHYKVNLQDAVIRWWTGSEIVLMDLSYMPSDPLFLRLGGLELTGAFIDESNEVNITAIEILKSRLGRQMNKEYNLTPKLFETFNPDKKHVYARYWKPYKEHALPQGVQFVRALATDNIHNAEQYIEQLRNIKDPITRQRLWLGNFDYDDDPSCLFDHDMMLDLFTNQVEESDDKYASVDVARFGNDATVIRLWRGLHCYKTIRLVKKGVNEVISKLEEVEKTEKIRRSHFIVDEDGVGGGVVDGFKGCKGFLNGSKPLIPSGSKEAPNYANLKTQCYFEFARLSKQGKIRVTCQDKGEEERIVEDLSQIKQANIDREGKISLISKEQMKEALGRSPDDADSLMMRMFFEIRKTPLLKPYFV